MVTKRPAWSTLALGAGLTFLIALSGCAGEDTTNPDGTWLGSAGAAATWGSATAGIPATGASGRTAVATGGSATVVKAGAGGKAGSGGVKPRAGSGGKTQTAGKGGSTAGKGGGSGQTTTPVDGCKAGPIPNDIRTSFDIDPFYQKYANANGVLVATGPKVSDEAIIKNCQLLLEMFSNEKIRQSIISRKMFFTMIAESEQLSSLPEIQKMYPTMPTIMDARARGLGSMIPTICAEDSILCMPSDKWRGDCICPHEYGHTLADWGVGYGDPALASRLSSIFDSIQSSGRLANSYATTQDGETSGIMAWGVQAWYNCAVEGTKGGYHSDINTRAELKKELPDFYEFLAELLPEDNKYKDCYYKP